MQELNNSNTLLKKCVELFGGKISLSFFCFLSISVITATPAIAPYPIFANGKLAGSQQSRCILKAQQLEWTSANTPKLRIIPQKHDFSKYDGLRITFQASRGGDYYWFTMTSNPADSKKWNYYYVKDLQIKLAGKQTHTIWFDQLRTARNPLGMDQIQSFEFNFIGWDLKYRPGLKLKISEIILLNKPKNAAEQTLKHKTTAAALVKILPRSPWISVPDITDRKLWNACRNSAWGKSMIRHADRSLAKKFQAPSRELYLECSVNGNRSHYQNAISELWRAYKYMTAAACMTKDKKYLNGLEELTVILCNKCPTWVWPAHDRNLTNFNKSRVTIDLVSSEAAGFMATASRLLAPELSANAKSIINREIRRQVLDPFLLTVDRKRSPDWWINGTNNWNAVCISGIAEVLLAFDIDADKRARAMAYLIEKSANFLKGFNPVDGYCSEGVSYWNYGFGRYLKFTAMLYNASKGKINLLAERPQAMLPAYYPEKIIMAEGLYPTFSDCVFTARIIPYLLGLRDYLLGISSKHSRQLKTVNTAPSMQLVILGLPERKLREVKSAGCQLFSGFCDSGIYVGRPEPGSECKLCVAFKGGSNHEFHNHNDVGSFIVAVNKVPLLVDPGAVVYTRDSFGPDRYKNRIINSFGHSVPVIDGRLQSVGKNTDAVLLAKSIDKKKILVKFNIRPAYKETVDIKRLERTFIYCREGKGTFTIIDEGEFGHPVNYESTLITFGDCKHTPNGKLVISEYGQKLEVSVDTGKIPWRLKSEMMPENIHWKKQPRRLSIILDGRQSRVKIKFTVRPL